MNDVETRTHMMKPDRINYLQRQKKRFKALMKTLDRRGNTLLSN